ncbi:hypothetical protein Tco_1120966 [Tanacetum coccineum]|uniref:Uncharacterized protein n=1 Tax=Tanacetum coccineum TaxID=301880 RepID=A0ABQ5IXE8_9ASTR
MALIFGRHPCARFRYPSSLCLIGLTFCIMQNKRIRAVDGVKENGVNILKSIDEGPFQMGIFWETLAEGTEGCLVPERLESILTCHRKDKERMQLNSKFVNNMLPEWGRFVTAVKLNRGLRDSNYDQLLSSYLKAKRRNANKNKMLLDRFTQHTLDPLALMSIVAPQQYNLQSSINPSSSYVPPHFAENSQLDSGLSPTDNLIENLTNILALLTQSYKTYLPQINNQLKTSSNPRNQAPVQDSRVVVQNVQGRQNRGQGNNARGGRELHSAQATTELRILQRQDVTDASSGESFPHNSREYGTYYGCGGWFAILGESLEEYGIETLDLSYFNLQ